MKKIASFSFITAVALSANMLPNNVINTSSLAQENGGTKTAIDAYSDGAGAYVIGSQGGVKMDNSPMNNLVFKFGEEAKANNVRLDDQVITIDALISTTAQKADAVKLNAVKLALEGTTCNDNSTLTMLDRYENGVCVGTVMNCVNGYFGNYLPNINCENGLLSTANLSNGWFNLTSAFYISLWNNPLLTNVDGLKNLTNVESRLYLDGNPSLTNINGLTNLISLGGNFTLYNNPALTDVSGLRNVTYVGGYILFDNRTYTTKLPANSYLCQNYSTKIAFSGTTYANATTKLQVCNP